MGNAKSMQPLYLCNTVFRNGVAGSNGGGKVERVGELQQMGSVAIASPPHDGETSAFGITLDYWYYTPSCAGMSTPAQRVVVSGSTGKEKRVGYGGE